MLRRLTLKNCKIEKNSDSYVSTHQLHKEYRAWSFLKYVRPIQRLISVDKTICSSCFWHPVTLKQGQGHQTWYEVVDPRQGYNTAKFERPHLNSVYEKENDK